MKFFMLVFVAIATLLTSVRLQAQQAQMETARVTTRLESKSGSSVSGTVDFKDNPKGMSVDYNIKGLKPKQKHGFHVHETGDCSAADASSAKDHWNPLSKAHAGLNTPQSHGGDFGNITANKKGEAKGSLQVNGVKTTDVMKLAIVVHDGADDLKTQPSGNSGSRVACGVIGLKE